MPVEAFESGAQGRSVLTRNFVCARGIEVISTTDSSGTTTALPLYDCHGNMVATLTKNTAGTTWSTGNLREYDVWGTVRTGQQTGSPANRYCANLGHVSDDESGLTYMRARYYEPTTGRFISEDPAEAGVNWYIYVKNRPVDQIDLDGRFDGNYLTSIYQLLRHAISLYESASVNPELQAKAIRAIREIIRQVRLIGSTADILGECEIDLAVAESEIAGATGPASGAVLEGAMAEASFGGATLSISAVAKIVAQQLELLLILIM